MADTHPELLSLADTHPELLAQWDADANNQTPEQVTADSNQQAHWVCPAGHRWKARILARAHGSSCPYCTDRIPLIPGRTDLASLHPGLAAEWGHANDRAPEQVTAGSNYLAVWLCPAGHLWQATVSGRVQGLNCCPTCYPIAAKSTRYAPRSAASR